MGIGMWVFWILLIVVIVVLVRVFAAGGSAQQRQDTPLDILKARYARGEIDEEEFERRRRVLQR
jgi:putative membrane protein